MEGLITIVVMAIFVMIIWWQTPRTPEGRKKSRDFWKKADAEDGTARFYEPPEFKASMGKYYERDPKEEQKKDDLMFIKILVFLGIMFLIALMFGS